MSAKRSIINMDRFKSLENLSEKLEKSDKNIVAQKSRFDIKPDENGISLIPLEDLEDAPDEWNFYKPLSEDKFLELLESIEENFLLNPVIVWQNNEKYTILSGHNRVRAFKTLLEATGDEKYKKIPSIVKSEDEIDSDQAREIIIDTNWVQRQLSTYEKTMSIINKYVKAKNQRQRGQKTRDFLSEKLGISGRMVQNYLSLNELYESFFQMIDDGLLTIKAAVIISRFDIDVQREIFENSSDLNLDLKSLKNSSKFENKDDIISALKKDDKEEYEILKLEIPKNKKDEFLKIYNDFMENLKK